MDWMIYKDGYVCYGDCSAPRCKVLVDHNKKQLKVHPFYMTLEDNEPKEVRKLLKREFIDYKIYIKEVINELE